MRLTLDEQHKRCFRIFSTKSIPPFVDQSNCVQFYQFSIQLSTAEAAAYHRLFRCCMEMYRVSDKFARRHFVQLLGRSFLAPRSVGI